MGEDGEYPPYLLLNLRTLAGLGQGLTSIAQIAIFSSLLLWGGRHVLQLLIHIQQHHRINFALGDDIHLSEEGGPESDHVILDFKVTDGTTMGDTIREDM